MLHNLNNLLILHIGIIWDLMGFDRIVNIIVSCEKAQNKNIRFCQIIYKPGSVIEDVISLGLNSHLSSSG